MNEVILHHYPQSPMAEKARLALGFKGLSWHSVEVPRLPPKPDFIPLTGGYRRVPVMQLGADIYCDSQCILPELERRFGDPSFFPGSTKGAALALARWSDGTLFDHTIAIIVASAGDTMPAEWVKDRLGLMFGAEQNLGDLQNDTSHHACQLRAQLGWIDLQLAESAFLLGDEPSLADFSLYPIIWVLRARWDRADEVLSQYSALEVWEARVAAIGHGSHPEMRPEDALEAARSSEPTTPEQGDPHDIQGLEPGMRVTVRPDGSNGNPEVGGVIRFVSADTIGLWHENDRVGAVCIHFPRVGYRVNPA